MYSVDTLCIILGPCPDIRDGSSVAVAHNAAIEIQAFNAAVLAFKTKSPMSLDERVPLVELAAKTAKDKQDLLNKTQTLIWLEDNARRSTSITRK